MVRPIRNPLSPDQRAVIGQVAEALFAERGFEGTPIREIAQKAGSTKALIYHYYRNKEDLYLSLIEAAVSEVVTQVEEIAESQAAFEEKMRGVVGVFLDYYRLHPQRFQMVQRAVDEHSPAALTLAERWFSRVHLAIQKIVAEGVRQGELKALPLPMASFVVVGLTVHALRIRKFMDRMNPDFSSKELLKALPDLLLTLLQADSTAKTKAQSKQKGRE